jgi:hypothetical protein
VFACPLTEESPVDTAEQAAALVDYLNKARPGCSALIFLFAVGQVPCGDNAWDLTSGMPTSGILDRLDTVDAVLWRAYVHLRLAWEAGGCLERARRWDAAGFTALPIRDDDRLEDVLNECAVSDIGRLSDQERSAAISRVTFTARSTGSPATAEDRELEATGTFWRPPGESRSRPAPWFARALLSQGDQGAANPLLRSSMVCAPLAREILGRCLALEGVERSRGLVTLRGSAAPDFASERFVRFQEGVRGFGAEFYPPRIPCRPRDPWHFVTLGELTSMLPRETGRGPGREDLRNLRNAIAHGHWVGWHAVQVLKGLERRCGG